MRIQTLATVTLATFAALTLLALQDAVAQQGSASRIFTCKDASGKTLTSDRPIPECQGREGRVLSTQGTTVKKIEALMTAEQEAARDAEEAKKKEDAVRRAEQLRKDKALLNTYQNLDDLESKRQRALLEVERDMKDADRRVSFLEKQEQELKLEEEFFRKKPLPVDLKRRLDENEGGLRAERGLLRSKKDEIVQVNVKFDLDKKRYVELTGSPSRAAKK